MKLFPLLSNRLVPLAIIFMNWFFLPSYEQIVAPKKGDDVLHLDKEGTKHRPFSKSFRFDDPPHNFLPATPEASWTSPPKLNIEESKKMTTAKDTPSSNRDPLMESAAKWNDPPFLSSMSNQDVKRDSRRALKTTILWHYPTVSSPGRHTKRTTTREHKHQSSSKDQNSSLQPQSLSMDSTAKRQSKAIKPFKRDSSPEAASKWHYPTAFSKSSPIKTTSLKFRSPPSKRSAALHEKHPPSMLSARLKYEHTTWEEKRDKMSKGFIKLRSLSSLSSMKNEKTKYEQPLLPKRLYELSDRSVKWQFFPTSNLESNEKTANPTKRTLPGKKRFLNFIPDAGLCSRLTGSSGKKTKSAFTRSYSVGSTIRVSGRPWRFVDGVIPRSIKDGNDAPESLKNKNSFHKQFSKVRMSKMRKNLE